MVNLDNYGDYMETIEDVIERLTHNGDYATSLCLLLYLTDNTKSLYYLDYLKITGKDLDNLEKLLSNESVEFLVQTIRFLRSGFLGINEIRENLNSTNPIPFIPRLLRNGEDWENAYEDFSFNFRKQMRNNQGRKSC